MSNLIGFRLFLIRFRVEAFPFHQILSQKMFQNLKINDVYVYPFLRHLIILFKGIIGSDS